MVPAAGDPCMDQLTVRSTASVTLAENLRLAPRRTLVVAGLTVTAGGGMIVNVRAPDFEAPGSGFATVTLVVPAVVIVCVNFSAVEETNAVATAEPSSSIVEPATKPFPFTVTVNVPTLTAAGVKEVIEGAGFSHVTVASAKAV